MKKGLCDDREAEDHENFLRGDVVKKGLCDDRKAEDHENSHRGDVMKKEKGTMADFMAAGLCMLAMTAVMISFMGNVGLVRQREQISQIARKYILRMETRGELTDGDRTALLLELEQAGATGVQLEGTTLEPVGYGETVVLIIRGKLGEEYAFEEKKVSAAKH